MRHLRCCVVVGVFAAELALKIPVAEQVLGIFAAEPVFGVFARGLALENLGAELVLVVFAAKLATELVLGVFACRTCGSGSSPQSLSTGPSRQG